MIKIRKIYINYTLFTILVTLMFFYLKFPSDSFRNYTELLINRNNLPFRVDISSTSLKIPPGVSYRDIFISSNNYRSKVSDFLNIYPSLLSLFSEFSISGNLLGGNLEGKFNKEGTAAEGSIKKIKIEKLPIGLINQIPKGYSLKGLADLDFKIDKKGKSSDGKLNLMISRLLVNIPEKSVKSILIDRVDSECSIKNETLSINKMEISAIDFAAGIKGTIYRNKIIENSRIDLNITFEPSKKAFEKYGRIIPLKMIMGNKSKISFKLTGTLKKPLFKL